MRLSVDCNMCIVKDNILLCPCEWRGTLIFDEEGDGVIKNTRPAKVLTKPSCQEMKLQHIRNGLNHKDHEW